MTTSNHERATAFLRALADGDVEAAAEVISPNHRTEVAAAAPTYSSTDLQPAAALDRLRLLLLRQYGAFEEVTELTTADGDDENETIVDATLAFENGTQPIRLGFDAEGQITTLDLKQAYALPVYADTTGYTEREITMTIDDGEDEVLDATLNLPTNETEAAVPGIVLIKADGRRDRDYTMGPNKPYRDIATGLASRGIAVLRYEERTLAPREDGGMLGLETMVADALTAVEQLSRADGVDPDRLFVAGWSFGGLPLPRVATEHGELAGLALLDTPPYRDVWETRGDHYRARLEEEWLTDTERDAIEAIADRMDKAREDFDGVDRVQGITTDVLKEFVAHDHGELLRERELPKFVLGTGREVDTAFETGFDRWQEMLPETTTSFVWCPALNHAFQRGEGPAIGLASGLLRDSVDRRVIDELSDWIHDV